MPRPLAACLPLFAILAAGCAASPAEIRQEASAQARIARNLDRRLAGLTPGTPQTCLNAFNLQSQVFGDTIVYREGRTAWVTRTTGGCFGLRRDDILVTQRVGTAQSCRGDIIQTADRNTGFPSGACSFGEFVPYRPARS